MTKVRATAVVCKDDSTLMIHRFRDGQEYYVLPGGKVEENEKPEEGVLRELVEETSITARLIEKIFSFNDGDGREHQLFRCEYVSGEPKLKTDSVEQGRSSDNNRYLPMWVEIKKLPNLTIWPKGTKEFLLEYFGK